MSPVFSLPQARTLDGRNCSGWLIGTTHLRKPFLRPRLGRKVFPRMLRPPPPWMQAWRRMVAALRHYRLRLWAGVSTATRLGLLPADGYGTPLEDKETKKERIERCEHDPKDMRRYGNMHGSFSKCNKCGLRFRWHPDQGLWIPDRDPPSSRSSVPPPSSSNMVLPHQASELRSLRSKAKPKPSTRTTRRSSATSSATPSTARRRATDAEENPWMLLQDDVAGHQQIEDLDSEFDWAAVEG